MTEHAKISYFKSTVRLVGYGFGMGASIASNHPGFAAAFIVLAFAELLGIIEEFGA